MANRNQLKVLLWFLGLLVAVVFEAFFFFLVLTLDSLCSSIYSVVSLELSRSEPVKQFSHSSPDVTLAEGEDENSEGSKAGSGTGSSSPAQFQACLNKLTSYSS